MATYAMLVLGLLGAATAARRVVPCVALLLLVLAFASVGGFVLQARIHLPADDISFRAGERNLVVFGTVASSPEDRGWYRRMQLRVRQVEAEGGPAQDVSGVVMLHLPAEFNLALGDRVRIERASVRLPPEADEPGEFDYRAWLRRQGITALMTGRAAEITGTERGLRVQLGHLGLRLREQVVGGVEEAMPGVDGALYSRLLLGMVYGLTAGPLPPDVIEQFRRAGTIHLLVVSGAQVSIIALAVVGLTGAGLRRGMRWWQGLLAALCIGVLILIVGVEASIGRAAAMFALLLMASITSRDYDVFTAVAFAAAIICIFDPWALFTLSFQLTFAATLGIVLFIPRTPLKRINDRPAAFPLPQLRAVFWATAGAWLLTSPVLACSLAQFAVSGNLANLVNVPLSLVIRILGFIALPLSIVPGGAALLVPLCWVARGLLRLVMHVNSLATGLPLAFAHDLQIGLAGAVAFYLAIAGLFAFGLVGRAHRWFDEALLRLHPSWPAVGAFGFASLLVVSHLAAGAPAGQLEMTVLPVGAGQATVIRTPGGRSMLIDCGSEGHAATGRDVAEQIVLPHLVARRLQRLDAVIISHWHADHFNALPRVLEAVDCGLLIAPPELDGFPPPQELRPVIDAIGRRAVAGAVLELEHDVTARLLAPRQPLLTGTRDDPNNNSVVVLLEHGSARMLIPGDIGPAGMRRLLRDARAAGWSLRVDLLVLPHHGRELLEMTELLDATQPRWAVASCDYKAEDYLSEAALAELERRDIRLLRTDQHGTVTVFSDGRRMRVSTTRGSLATGAWVEAAR